MLSQRPQPCLCVHSAPQEEVSRRGPGLPPRPAELMQGWRWAWMPSAFIKPLATPPSGGSDVPHCIGAVLSPSVRPPPPEGAYAVRSPWAPSGRWVVCCQRSTVSLSESRRFQVRFVPGEPSNCLSAPMVLLVASLGFRACKVMSSIDRDRFTFRFPVWTLFVSCSSDGCGQPLGTFMFSESGESWASRFLPDPGGQAC